MLSIGSSQSENSNSSDRTFLLELYQQFYRLMFTAAGKYCLDSDACEEVVQESLVKLIKKTALLRNMQPSSLASYIVSTTRNTAINYVKSKSKRNTNMSSLEEEMLSDLETPDLPLDEQMYKAERREYLSKLLEQLSTEDQMLLEGKYILEYSDEVLAKMLGCKPGSIRMKLTRVRRRVLKLIEQEGVIEHDKT